MSNGGANGFDGSGSGGTITNHAGRNGQATNSTAGPSGNGGNGSTGSGCASGGAPGGAGSGSNAPGGNYGGGGSSGPGENGSDSSVGGNGYAKSLGKGSHETALSAELLKPRIFVEGLLTKHHGIFERFERTHPFDDERYHHNFMGARISHGFERDFNDVIALPNPEQFKDLKSSGRSAAYDVDPTYPEQQSEDYFEWIDLLTAIDRAKGAFSMIEIGAGYGRWIANAAAALRRHKGVPLMARLVGVEASRARFDLMVANCAINEIPASGVELIRAACTTDGRPMFMGVSDDYGSAVVDDPKVLALFDGVSTEQVWVEDDSGKRFQIEKMPGVRLSDLLSEQVDFIDLDIQGAETDLIPEAIDALNKFAKLVHVGTHSAAADSVGAATFHIHGWRPRWKFPAALFNQTPFGAFRFIDGIQSWENPRLD